MAEAAVPFFFKGWGCGLQQPKMIAVIEINEPFFFIYL